MKRDSDPLLPRSWRLTILALVVLQFLVGHGLVWRQMFDWDRAILASYATIPAVVLIALVIRKQLRFVSWCINTIEIACYKFGITASFLLVLLITNDEPPPTTTAAVAPMMRGPKLPAPSLRGAPPPSETISLGGRAIGPDGAPVEGALVFVSGLEEYDYPRATGSVSVDGMDSFVAAQLGQRVVMHAGDARLHAMVVRPRGDARVLFHVPALPSGAPVALPFDERSFGVHEIECTIHRHERAHVGMFAHPFFQHIGADGRFAFRDVPLGARRLHAFHPRFGESVVPLNGKSELVITLVIPLGKRKA